ncbi:MAG: ABC transporter substrate-binding protein [Lachnospiraceae bacterium]
MKNKILSMLLVTAMVATMLVGCGDSKNTDTKTETETETETDKEDKDAEPSTEAVTLKTVSMFAGTDPNAEAYQEISKQFQKEYDYITLEDNSQTSDQDWKQSIAADFAVGNEPDVIQFFTDATANTVLATDKFVTLKDIQAEYPDYAKDITDVALKATANPDGVNRAVPTTGYWEGLFCNKDLFDQYKVALPTDWATFTTAIETFKKNGIIPIACSLNNVPHYWLEYCMLYTAGLDEYQSVPATAPESWIKGLETIKTLRDMGAFPEDTDTVDDAYAGELFKTKKAAMQLDGSWYAGGVVEAGNAETTVVVPFPGVENQKAEANTIISGMSSGFYITKKAWDDPAKRDAAVKYVMANTSKEGIQKYWESTGKIQVTAAELEAPEGLSTLGKSALELVNAATATALPTDARLGTDPYSVLTTNVAKISVGSVTAKDIINEALALYKELNPDAE